MFMSEDNDHFTNRFYKDDLTTILTWYHSLSIEPLTIYIHASSPKVLGVRGCIGKIPSFKTDR